MAVYYRIVWFLSACAYLENSKKYAPKSQVRSVKLATPPIYTCTNCTPLSAHIIRLYGPKTGDILLLVTYALKNQDNRHVLKTQYAP